jgi:hypothetical protein
VKVGVWLCGRTFEHQISDNQQVVMNKPASAHTCETESTLALIKGLGNFARGPGLPIASYALAMVATSSSDDIE